jgi:excisionase family DNA binding protein
VLQEVLKNINPDREHMTTAQAADRSDLSAIYLRQLLRQGKLEGFQLGRDWYIYADSLETFLQRKRKPGPKGPRQKVNPNKQRSASNSSS